MFDIKRKTIDWGGRKLTLETGRMARQADGAVLATYGDTMVLATAVFAKSPKPGQDFFPLTVNYQEKFYAAGKIPGSFPRREGAPSQKETLTSRLIDRPIRPLFVKGFKNEVQVVATVLAHDLENDPDIVALVAASAALVISGAPFMGPIGAARVGFIDGEYVLNPTLDQMKEDNLMDLVVAGTADAVMMVESEIQELSEEQVLGGVTFAHKEMQAVIDAIIELADHSAKEPFDFQPDDTDALKADVKKLIGKDFAAAYKIVAKGERQDAVAKAKAKATEKFGKSDANPAGIAPDKLGAVFKDLEADVVRRNILDTGIRIDGRKVDQVRPIVSEVGVLSRAHGSALFTRGETQALVVATLGTGDDEQLIDALEGKSYSKFMLHYNFPPFSVGETGRMGAPGRREVGHGKLAWRAIRPMLPSEEEFPYTIRLVSEIFESNGSSSMASVCGSSLALMDAGVPLKKSVSGIAMGLILEKDGFAVLSDILGDEDHLGDMDFKVAGTHDGITSLQMDIKIAGITEEIMKQALAQAKGGREHILGEMEKAMEAPRAHLGEYAPKIETMKIAVDKIREVIGSGGKVIREITAETGAKIDIGEDGTIKIAAAEQSKIDAAREWIKGIASEPEVGQIYTGKVVKIVDFGAFVNFFGSKDGLVHVSQIANQRVDKVGDVLQEGQAVKVKLLGFDDRGKTRLSMKVVDQETGEDLSKKEQPETADA
ncbi:MAG: polyribonucleotide nucleotidyltransferase [Phenylobacterium sp.]|nr:MAG: polyribonucleotide nucleotidyltransferase [Phenylobacterium sp.]